MHTTLEEFEALLKGLMIMRLYCPEEVEVMVDAAIAETEFRMGYVQ